jgi:hypothetical protein
MAEQARVIEGERFDSPLVMAGGIDAEPQRYIAEKPYELTKFEFAVLRRRTMSSLWFNLVAGATAGVLIAIAGKALASLLEKKPPTVESWEVWAVAIGIVLSIAIRCRCLRSSDEREKGALEGVIDGHFATNRPRRVHLTGNSEPK